MNKKITKAQMIDNLNMIISSCNKNKSKTEIELLNIIKETLTQILSTYEHIHKPSFLCGMLEMLNMFVGVNMEEVKILPKLGATISSCSQVCAEICLEELNKLDIDEFPKEI